MQWPLRIFLIRHGQVASNREMRYVGSRDEPLTELGRAQARSLGEALAPLPIEAVVSSPLERARQTAHRVAESRQLVVRLDDRLREQSYGEWDGLSSDEARARDPDLHARWVRSDHVEPPGGESQIAMQSRVLDLVEEELEAANDLAGNSQRCLALVSHVGPIKAILAAALDIGLMNSRRLFLDPATISIVDWGSPPIVRVCNANVHGGLFHTRWIDPEQSASA